MPKEHPILFSEPMKALTVCQPYAHLICLPDADERAKRVENRTWPTSVRGEILIHAGKGRKYLNLYRTANGQQRDVEYNIELSDMTFGAFVAVAKLAACVQLGHVSMHVGHFEMSVNGKVTRSEEYQRTGSLVPPDARERFPWLATHLHTEGPFCFVLTDVRPLAKPIPFRGAQGFFNVPAAIEDAVKREVNHG